MKALFALLSLVALLASPISVVAQSQAEGQKQKIILGQVGLSFYAVVGGVVQELLEREGYSVEVAEGPHAKIFPLLGVGQVDIFAAAWLPHGHADLFASVEDMTFRIAPLYEDARFFWVVPAYVPESALSSLTGLVQPEVQQRVSKRIVSLPAETGLTISARRVLDAYNLGEAGYEIVAAPPSEWFGTFREATKDKKWVIFPLWQPRSLREKLPTRTMGLLSNIRLSIEAVTKMDRMVNVERLSPRDSARRWMEENADLVQVGP